MFSHSLHIVSRTAIAQQPSLVLMVILVFPEQVVALDAQIIVALSCGEAHTLALNDKGQVFAWGLASDGQLGFVNSEESIRVPR